MVEVALIRPGPIQGGSVHPYIRRRNGQEEVTYLHPLLEPALSKTLGVPLFQEQLMQMAIDVAGFSPGEADQLRQAMGSKRSRERMERLRQRLYDGMAERGITGEVADQIYDKLAAFANFGFPESHSVSFAYLVYASSWLKLHEPAAFCAALLNAQPMGFYSPHSLVQDARRHGVEVRTPDVNASADVATLEPCADQYRGGGGAHRHRLGAQHRRRRGRAHRRRSSVHRHGGRCSSSGPQPAAARGLGDERCVRLLRDAATRGVVDGRCGGAIEDGQVGWDRHGKPTHRSCRAWTDRELAHADLWATGVSPEGHPTRFVRAELERLGVATAVTLAGLEDGQKVLVGGVVTHRQRPATAAGITFINLEDETGLINVVCSKGCWARYRRAALGAPALLIRGRLEKVEGVINVVAERLEPLPLAAPTKSRDFR